MEFANVSTCISGKQPTCQLSFTGNRDLFVSPIIHQLVVDSSNCASTHNLIFLPTQFS